MQIGDSSETFFASSRPSNSLLASNLSDLHQTISQRLPEREETGRDMLHVPGFGNASNDQRFEFLIRRGSVCKASSSSSGSGNTLLKRGQYRPEGMSREGGD